MIYKLIIALLIGYILGIIFWERFGVGDEYKNYINKIKNRKGIQNVDWRLNLGTSPPDGTLTRKERRVRRRALKTIARAERKANK